jgi:3-methyladenine DNA glycosylase AlkD
VPAILTELRGMGSERDRVGMARYGINVENAFGVSVYELRKVAKSLGTDHDLALALWATGNHEARLLACFIHDPASVTEESVHAVAAAPAEHEPLQQNCPLRPSSRRSL